MKQDMFNCKMRNARIFSARNLPIIILLNNVIYIEHFYWNVVEISICQLSTIHDILSILCHGAIFLLFLLNILLWACVLNQTYIIIHVCITPRKVPIINSHDCCFIESLDVCVICAFVYFQMHNKANG